MAIGSDDDATKEVMFFLSPENIDEDPSTLLQSESEGQIWRTMLRDGGAAEGDEYTVQSGQSAAFGGGAMTLRVTQILSHWVEEREPDGVEVCLEVVSAAGDGAVTMESQFSDRGVPYMKREATAEDTATYQTTFASTEAVGSVAAPTAGLHLTLACLKQLADQGARSSRLALHVGAGTFRPVTSPTVATHPMHAKFFEVSA